MTFYNNYDITHLTTFGIKTSTQKYLSFKSSKELKLALTDTKIEAPVLVIGGGSNLLFLNNYKGTIVHPQNKEVRIVSENESTVEIEAEAGVVWDDFVAFCVERGFGGAENLSLIPGSVGASPVQNIGAYGVEVADIIKEVRFFEITNAKEHILSKEECNFGYRDSIFKSEWKGRVVVSSVVFELKKNSSPSLRYGQLKDEVEKHGPATIANVRQAVIDIRNSKLPDPVNIGNGGSFFKNPVVDASLAESIKKQYPNVPTYPAEEGKVKIAAGWLIDQAGWKGYRKGDAGVHEHQALVLVNYGKATGKEILNLSEEIEKDILLKFGIVFEKEVLLIR